MATIDLSKNFGIDTYGNQVYGFKGCYRYCVEPNNGFIYIAHEDNRLEETSFLYLCNFIVQNSKEVLGGIVFDKNCCYIDGNKFSKFRRLNKEYTSLNGFNYSIIVGRGMGFDKKSINDKDVQDILLTLDENVKKSLIRLMGESEDDESILFIKFRGWIILTIYDKNNDSANIICAQTGGINAIEKELTIEYIRKSAELILRRGSISFDESSIVDIEKEDAVYCFREMERDLHQNIHDIRIGKMTKRLGLAKGRLFKLKDKINSNPYGQKSINKFLHYKIVSGYFRATLTGFLGK